MSVADIKSTPSLESDLIFFMLKASLAPNNLISLRHLAELVAGVERLTDTYSVRISKDHSKSLDVDIWCVEGLSGKYTHIDNDLYFFDSKEDATLFKMFWG